MKFFQGKQEDYRKNLACMEEVTDRLLGHMKGHGFSFRQEITDSKGDFSQEKLCGLVEELVERWVETLRESTDKDPSTGRAWRSPISGSGGSCTASTSTWSCGAACARGRMRKPILTALWRKSGRILHSCWNRPGA